MKTRKMTRQKNQNASAMRRKELNAQIKIMKNLAAILKRQKTPMEKKYKKPVAKTYDVMIKSAQQGGNLLQKKLKNIS